MIVELEDYLVSASAELLTPALLVYPRFVDSNIEATLRVMDGDANRWRPHIKTAKMPWVVRRLMDYDVLQFKCATSLELRMAASCGAPDVLVAYPMVGLQAKRVVGIAAEYPGTRVSVLVENLDEAGWWVGKPVGVFIDVNPGMDRTGLDQDAVASIVAIARKLGRQFRGIHYYDGHISAPVMLERERLAHAGYERLLRITRALDAAGIACGEVITSGTPAFPCAMNYPGFREAAFVHRVSPGTVVFNGLDSLSQLPEDLGYRPAALVVATVVSHPIPGRFTCDAGHKSVSADAGVPTCAVIGRPELLPLKPSEEHLPVDVPAGAVIPAIGEALYLLPRHVCPTVNLFDSALMMREGAVSSVEPISARGHESITSGLTPLRSRLGVES